jgi:hypothetical protein
MNVVKSAFNTTFKTTFFSAFMLLAANVQAVEQVRDYTDAEVFVRSCNTLYNIWNVKDGYKAITTKDENILSAGCYSTLKTTMFYISGAADSKIFNGICVPKDASYQKIINTIQPLQNEIVTSHKDQTPQLIMLAAFKIGFPCQKDKT